MRRSLARSASSLARPEPFAPPSLSEARHAERVRLLVDGVTDYAIYLLDAEGRISSWNAGAAHTTGYSAAEIVGHEMAHFYPSDARARSLPALDLARAARGGRAEDEGWRVRKDGTRYWANVVLTALRDDRGLVTGYACVTRDLTDRKAAEDALRARSEHLAAVVSAQQEITTGGLALDVILPRLVERARELTGADVAIVELREGANTLARAHHGDSFLDVPLATLLTPGWPSLRSGLVECARYDDQSAPCEILGAACEQAGVGAMLAMPITHEGALLGCLAVLARSSLAFDEQDTQTLQLMTGLLAAPLAHAQAFEAKRALVAERTLALAAYRESEARFRAAMDASLDALFILGAVRDAAGAIIDFEYLDTNRRGEELCGLARSALLGERLSRVYAGEGMLGQLDALADVVETRTAFEREREMVVSRGRTRWVQEQVVPLEDGVTVTVRDITARKEAEAETRRARDAAEAANQAKTDFVARMSHELRTPLNSVIGFANILLRNKRGSLDDAELTYLQRVQGAGTHLLGLINDVLDIAKVEAGRMTIELSPVELVPLARDVLAQFDAQAQAAGIALRLDAPAGGAVVFSDVGKLHQVLINLVGNALKFTPEGSVVVRIRADGPAVADNGSAIATCIEVVDTGIGIPPDRLSAIFEAFEQADSSTSRHYGGTGLGLSISRALCEAMGFSLTVESRLNAGTMFRIGLTPARVGTA
jgi:PAS domain S-box-containing protein